MKIFLIIWFLLTAFQLSARQKPALDTSSVNERGFNENDLRSYRSDRNFQYENEVAESPSLWSRFWAWVWDKYEQINRTEAGRITLRILFWTLLILAAALFIYKVLQMNRASPFSRGSVNIAYTVDQENIHEIDFQKSLNDAVASKNYRLAVRLWYLQILKTLSDKKFIDWQINKTNTDYQHEVREKAFAADFNKVTRLFDSVWYGNREVHEDEYFIINNDFESFKSSLI